jgi:DNA-binding transcriptional LysR family regulator
MYRGLSRRRSKVSGALRHSAEPGALHRFPCAVWASRVDVSARWELGGHVVEPTAVLSTNDYHHPRSRAPGGDVVTDLPLFLAAVPIWEKRLVPLLPQYPLPEWSINLPYQPQRHRPAVVRAFLD